LSGVQQQLGTQVAGGLGNIGAMFYGAPMTELNYNAQAAIAAQNASAANAAAMAGLGSGALQGLGSLLGGALKFSDARIKEDIEPVGKLADDQTVYRYHFKGDPTPHIGLLAQEVEQVAPEAVGDILPGIKGVNYAVATDRAAALMKLSNDNRASPLIVYGAGLMERAA